MTLADRINQRLASNKLLTQAGLARACTVSRASVNGWTSGKTASIDGKHLTTAAAYLGVNPHWLSTGQGNMEAATPAPAFAYTSEPLVTRLHTAIEALEASIAAEAAGGTAQSGAAWPFASVTREQWLALGQQQGAVEGLIHSLLSPKRYPSGGGGRQRPA